jgi:Ca2+-binding RTX toxin-like protein
MEFRMPTIEGTSGNDNLVGTQGWEYIYGLGGQDHIEGNGGNDYIDGGDDDDVVDGGAGKDFIFSGGGHRDSEDIDYYDFVYGGEGDDVIVIKGEGDIPVFSKIYGGSGHDTLVFEADAYDFVNGHISAGGNGYFEYGLYTLRLFFESIETLVVWRPSSGEWNVSGFGNLEFIEVTRGDYSPYGVRDDEIAPAYNLSQIDGTNGPDILVGTEEPDTINGFENQDTISGNGGDDLIDGGEGADTAYGGEGNDVIYGGAGLDHLFGGSGNDTLIGNLDGNDIFDGGEGADQMRGGAGDDVYFVDNAGDTVIEGTGNGTDRVSSSVSFTLGGYIETLSLTGSANVNATGNGQANTLIGNTGRNTLNGGAGVDEMRGGAGDDIYVVDNAGDAVIEGSGKGTDRVSSSINYTLGAYVEDLSLTGSANIDATGNGLANVLVGNAGSNLLNGSTGADEMRGGAGNDFYVVDNAGDVVIEGSGNGTDTVNSSVSFVLGGSVENLVLTGAGATSGTGNNSANSITGNNAANILSGGVGADILTGGGGADDLFGGVGSDDLSGGTGGDRFRFDTALDGSSNVDEILDFNVADDSLYLDRDIFTGIGGEGALAAGAFRAGSSALDADDRVLYDSATGQIRYDADGAGGVEAILFATVTPGLALTNADFVGYS